jgi:hypothetical protein
MASERDERRRYSAIIGGRAMGFEPWIVTIALLLIGAAAHR